MSLSNHFNESGNAHMVDVGNKSITRRRAVAYGRIRIQAETLRGILDGEHQKGDVLSVARVAAIMGAKRTAELVPLCHPLSITHIDVDFRVVATKNHVECQVLIETDGKTGVEIEALLATQIALLTVYDMCKSVDRGMSIEEVRLLHKSGGRSGEWNFDEPTSPV